MNDLLDRLLASVERQEPVARVVVMRAPPDLGDRVGRQALVWLDRPPRGSLGLGQCEAEVLSTARGQLAQRRHGVLTCETETGPVELFVEVQGRPPTLLIVGAGHIAEPLAQLGTLCDFRVVVLDDRPRYANRTRFPLADEVIADDIEEMLRAYPLDFDTYIVLVTRGHQHDVHALLQVVHRPHAYIGMIGSKRRIKAVFELLERERGLSRESLGKVYAPIGLDIGAESPAEIAVAIMGEIILARRGGSAAPLSDALRIRSGRVHQSRIHRQAAGPTGDRHGPLTTDPTTEGATPPS